MPTITTAETKLMDNLSTGFFISKIRAYNDAYIHGCAHSCPEINLENLLTYFIAKEPPSDWSSDDYIMSVLCALSYHVYNVRYVPELDQILIAIACSERDGAASTALFYCSCVDDVWKVLLY